MRRIAILAAIVLPVVFILAFSAAAFASVAPHSGYGTGVNGTDFCVGCHDIHEAQGDYVLTREATVTALCGTCHGLFGAQAPSGVNWSSTPTDFPGDNPTASTKLAYKVNMSGASAQYMDSIPGHSLGVMYGGTVVRNSDVIPGSSATLKVMISGEYGGFTMGIYTGQAATSFNGTKGLYCASCHTPHGDANAGGGGYMIPGTPLLSSKPNHDEFGVAVDEKAFCISCHDKRDNDGPEHNHPDVYCLTCHDNPGGQPGGDFPHTSTNKRILRMEPDALCMACHELGHLP
jgi:predicted CXXCH cytochrome family protein